MTKNASTADFLSAATRSLADGTFARLTLAHYTGSEDLKKITVKKTLIKREEKLSFTYTHKTRDIVKNYGLEDGMARIEDALQTGFNAATLFTTGFDLAFDVPKDRLAKSPATTREAPSLAHDRPKNRSIDAQQKSWLHDLGITDHTGKVRKDAQDKFRQIDKYVEIIGTLIKPLPQDRIKTILDMGSGKGYLTFALYDYLTSTLGLAPTITGVEHRADMVDLCMNMAVKSGFENLKFAQGTIEDYDAAGTNILIALHACDTATDDAIAKGIEAGADLIVVAPCCHKQIRKEMGRSKNHGDLDFLLRHGIFMERQAEMVTDGLRALILEYFGYNVKVFEFIGGEHTPKNILIVGTKNPKAAPRSPAILARIAAAKAVFGITRHRLEDATGL